MFNKFGFVILHYLAVEDTIECIKSIKEKIDTNNYLIVVVDNCSPDGSGCELENKYKNDSSVDVIRNIKNLGFSVGNNIGITHARNKGCDFIVVLNNDTYLLQNNFTYIILNEYRYSGFAVMGPKVFDPQGYNSTSPILEAEYNGIDERKGIYNMWRHIYWESVFGIDILKNAVRGKCNQKVKINLEPNGLSSLRVKGVPLHGCCLVFSPVYFKYFDGFEELTFMYGEETILKMNCDSHKLIMVYNPELKIFHKEAVSTKKEYTNHKKLVAHNELMYYAAKAIYKKALNND